MNTPLTTAEIVERLTDNAERLRMSGKDDALPRSAASALLALEGERDEAHKHAKSLTKALVGLTPGGSEYFTRSTVLDDYFADIEACTAVIRERFDSGHKAKLERVDERRRAEAAEAELAKVREERDAFFDKLRQLLCINSVLTALKADAPLWLEHAEKLIDDHNAALSEKTV